MVDFTLCCSHLRGNAPDRGHLNTDLRIKVAPITAAEEGNIAPVTYEAAVASELEPSRFRASLNAHDSRLAYLL